MPEIKRPWQVLLAFAVSIALLALAAQTHSPWLVPAAAVFVGVAVTTRGALAAWRRRGLPHVVIRMLVLIAVGAVLLVLWPRTGSDIVGFLGAAAVWFGAGQLLLAVREAGTWRPWRSPVLVGVLAAAFVAGLAVYTLESATWGVLTMAAAVLAAPIAIGLASEDLPADPSHGERPPRWAFWGAALLVAGVAGMVWFDVPVSYAAMGAAGLFLLVGAIASKTEGDIVVVLVALGLVWSLAPRDVDLSEAAQRDPGEPAIAALGDSFMSGEGAESFFRGTNDEGRNECRRAPTAYAAQIADPDFQGDAADRIPDRAVFIACSGAKAADIFETTQYPEEPGDGRGALHQVAQLAAVKDDVELVLLSIGGNDAGFGEIGRTCVLPGSCSQVGASWLDGLQELPAKLEKAYDAVHAVVPDTPVLVVPYPAALRERRCASSLLTADEHRFLAGFTGELNQVVRAAAARRGFHYLDGAEHALTRARLRICDTSPGKAGVNFLAANPVRGVVSQQVSPANWFHNSLHPNKRGHAVLREELRRWLAANPDPPARVTTGLSPRPVASVDALMARSYDHCAKPDVDLASCRSSIRHWTAGQVARVLWYGSPFVLLLVLGSFFVWMRLLAWYRSGRRPAEVS